MCQLVLEKRLRKYVDRDSDINVGYIAFSALLDIWFQCYLVPPGLCGRGDPLLGAGRRERLARDVQHVMNAAPVLYKTYSNSSSLAQTQRSR